MRILLEKEALEKEQARIQKKLKAIELSPIFKKEKALRRALLNLMKKYGCTSKDITEVLQSVPPPNAISARAISARKAVAVKARKPRKLKIYENPSTGERVETRGGNHKTLKTWKRQYNLDSVEHWLVTTKD